MSRARMTMATLMALLMVAALGWGIRARADDDQQKQREKVDKAREVYEELVKAPDRGVPEALLERARAIAIFPSVTKVAIGVGARRGKGVMVMRNAAGEWSAPAFYSLTGGSWGLQFGAESADVVLFFMTDRSARSLVDGKFTVGGKAGVSAGPVGRTAEASTDIKLDSEVYSYARSRGLFAGISLEGAKIQPDGEANLEFYGKKMTPQAILVDRSVSGQPEEATRLVAVLPSGPPK